MAYKSIDRIPALNNLIDQAGFAYIETDRHMRVTSWNSGAQALLGYGEDDAFGRPISEMIPVCSKALLDCRKTFQLSNVERIDSGRTMSCEIFCSPIMDLQGNPSGVSVLIKDISNSFKSIENSNDDGQRLADIIAFAPIGIYHVNLQGNVTWANPEFAWIMGYESPQALKQQMTEFSDKAFYDKETADEFLFAVYEAEEVIRLRCRMRRQDGSFTWALCYAKATKDSTDRINGFDGFCVDIRKTVRVEQQLKKANEKLRQQSLVDGLTKIFNRRKFDESLQLEWRRHFRSKVPMSVILCDIDFFKLYNDHYGHQAGDKCLKQVAQAIQSCVGRSSDLVARYGGEEFVLILPETDEFGGMAVSERIRDKVEGLELPHARSKVSDHVTLSLGVATLIPEDKSLWESIVRLADSALYEAKENGRNQSVRSRL